MKLVDITNNHFGGKKWCEWWLYLSSPESDDLSLSLPSIILETQKIKMNFYIKIELQKNQGTKWVQIRKLGLNWTFLANFEPTHFRCLFYIGHSSFNFPMANKKEAIGHRFSNWKTYLMKNNLGTKMREKKHCSNPQWIVRKCIVPMSIVWKLHLLVFFIISW